jgi:ATP-binding cassette subfamily C (CFTR/MRP) protein 4
MNRFTKDTYVLDEILPNTFIDFLQTFCIIIGVCLVIAVINPLTLVCLVFMIPLMFIVCKYMLKCAIEARRMEIATKGPVLTLMSNCIG